MKRYRLLRSPPARSIDFFACLSCITEIVLSKKILAVDDSVAMRQMVYLTLKSNGYDVAQARDGIEALELSRNTVVDLVLTDLHMPRMDGISLIRALRNQPAYKFVPMLVLTTESDTDQKAEGKRAGATGWLVKPFDPAQLLATIARVL
jgi:two-component system chemotaxis response regulator CheY